MKILSEYSLAVFSYCSDHNLKLIIKEASSSHECLVEFIETLEQIVNHILRPPHRKISSKTFMNHFNEENEGPKVSGLRPLCATRWTAYIKIKGQKMSVLYVRRMIEGVSEIFSMKNSGEFAVSFFDARVEKTMDQQIELPAARRGHLLTQRRGQSVEMEVDEIVISAAYTNLYKNFHDVALQSIFVRNLMRNWLLCKRSKRRCVLLGQLLLWVTFLSVTRQTSQIVSPKTYLATRSRVYTIWRWLPRWTWPGCQSKASRLSITPMMR